MLDEFKPEVKNGHEKQFINFGHEDQMELSGYKKSKAKSATVFIFYILTVGLLRLFFHWFPKFLLKSTHVKCGLEMADTILVVENYKGKYKTYFVEKVFTISARDSSNLKTDNDDILSYYLSDGKEIESVSVRGFTCKKVKYIWEDSKQAFVKLCGMENGVPQSKFHSCKGFSEREQYLRKKIYGSNEIDVPLESILRLFLLEALTPFYIFQVFSIIVWLCEEYYYYGIAIVIMSVFGIASSIIQTRKNQSNLRGTVHQIDSVVIKRSDDSFEQTPTTSLVPGDILIIPQHGCIMHCDAVLLRGNCIVNESMLTGESVPVVKTALPNVDKALDIKEDSNNVLFCGTKVIQTRYHGEEKVLAVVVRTGFLTAKGQLVKSIMYPPPADFKFDQDSYKYIGILGFIATLGVIYTIVSKSTRNIDFSDVIIKALDTVTIVIPPALPAAMTVGKLYALGRLKKSNIFCINSRVINVSGSINCVCFDKTGTLTEDGLDMWGVVPVEGGELREPEENVRALEESSKLLRGMVSCHSLTLIDGNLEGDPLDIKMFESTGWLLEEPEVPDYNKFDLLVPTIVKPPESSDGLEIGIVHQNQFSSKLQRMSVVTKIAGSPAFELYCKGSPEMIVSLSKPHTIPDDLLGSLKEYTEKGYRVIAMGCRTLEHISFHNIQKQNREDVERNLEFLGLIVLENKLKPQTTDIIDVLKKANMKLVMITGDNIQTALSVARECGIIEKGGTVIDVEAKAPTKTEDAKLVLNVSQLSIKVEDEKMHLSSLEDGRCDNKFHFAMTGQTWGIIKDYFPTEIPKFITRGSVFARMSSDQKQQLVEELQALGFYVSMCGDGANDCGALKTAHVGISLSEAEASVASPFTSSIQNITCVPEIIKQGRAALVTSFGIFKFMLMYSLTEFSSVIILYGIDCNLAHMQYLFIDLCLIMVFAFLFGKTDAYDQRLHNKPPTTSLIGVTPIASLILHIVCVIAFQTLSYQIIQTYEWFTPYHHIPNTNIFLSYENYAVFAISLFQYIAMAVIFSKGAPYRKPIFTNYIFTSILLIWTAVCIYIMFNPAKAVANFLDILLPPEDDAKYFILLLATAHFVMAYILEDFVVDFVLDKKVKPRFHNIELSRKKYLKVEKELNVDSKWKFGRAGIDNIAFENERSC